MTTATAAPQVGAGRELFELITGAWVSKAISVFAELGIADLMDSRPKSADELAAETGAHAPSLYRLLRAMTVPGILSESGTAASS